MSISTDVPAEPETVAARSAQPDDLRRQNVSAIMRTVLANGPVPRAEVAKRTGLAPGSVTKLTSRLLDVGLLREEPALSPAGHPGRPRVPLSIDTHYQVVGVHFGLLWTIIGVVDLTGRIVSEVTLQHDGQTSFDAIVGLAVDRLRRMTTRGAGKRILGVGASTGGWVDPQTGVVIEHPVLGWQNAPLRATIAERVRRPVWVDSTVRAMALAESWLGAARDVSNLLHVFVGNIVGAGMTINRRLHRGPRSAAGYLDHLPVGVRTDRRCECGRHDCLQAVASDIAVVADAQRRGLIGPGETVDDLAALARGGNHRAAQVLRTRARHVGSAIALLLEILNPDRVIVGGGVADHPEYLPELRAAMMERLHRPPHTDPEDLVTATSFGRQAVMLASATLLLDAFYWDPMAFPPLAPPIAL